MVGLSSTKRDTYLLGIGEAKRRSQDHKSGETRPNTGKSLHPKVEMNTMTGESGRHRGKGL